MHTLSEICSSSSNQFFTFCRPITPAKRLPQLRARSTWLLWTTSAQLLVFARRGKADAGCSELFEVVGVVVNDPLIPSV